MSTLIEDAEDVCAMEKKAAKERPILFSSAISANWVVEFRKVAA